MGHKFKSGRNVGYSFDNARKATYSYEADNGRLVGLEAEGEREFTFGYFPNSHLQNTIVYPNGMIKTVNYEQKRNLITSIAHGADTAPLSAYAYTNDALGRRTSMTRTFDDVTKTIDYGYNDRSEVTIAAQQGNNQYNYLYNYDNIGNRKSATENSAPKTYQANQLNQYIDSDFAFDLDGNQTTVKTSTGIWEVEYNGENRPIRFTQGTTTVTMDYDYMGRRFMKLVMVDGDIRKQEDFVYNGYLLVKDYIIDYKYGYPMEDVISYVWDPAAGQASRPLMMEGNYTTYYYAHDANKNVTDLTSEWDRVESTYEYSPFGAITASWEITEDFNPFLFSSEFHDPELGLTYYNYRHYNPTDGRWLSRDPIEEQGGFNLYSFANNNPVDFIDLLGNISINIKLLAYYLLRLQISTNFFTSYFMALLPNPLIIKDDENEMAWATYQEILAAMMRYHHGLSESTDGEWKEAIFNGEKLYDISAHEDMQYLVAGAHSVELTGTYMWCANHGESKVLFKDIDFNVIWHDQMDANSFQELKDRGHDKTAGSGYYIEGIIDLIESLFSHDFYFQIHYQLSIPGCSDQAVKILNPHKEK